MTAWYALTTEPSRERHVAAGLAERGFTFFLPMETTWLEKPHVKRMDPVFRGYVFVVITCDNDFAELRGLEHVTGFVRYLRDDGNLWAMPFPAREILGLQIEERCGTYDYTRDVKPAKYKPKKGARVQITSGPYQGFFAKVLRAKPGDRRELLIEGFDPPRHKTMDTTHLVAA